MSRASRRGSPACSPRRRNLPPKTGEARGDARRRLATRFSEAGIDSADIDARLLVCAAADIDHAGLIREPDATLDQAQTVRLQDFERRRLAREPVSRILGRREFWGLPFALDPAVLDPRPETEGLVASALDAIGGRRDDRLRVLDLGVGSGAILAALLHELPRAWGVGLDRSFAACRVAGANLAALGVGERSAPVCSDWTAPIEGRFDLVVSNPPYVATAELGHLAPDVHRYDPAAALDGGTDGLDAYRTIMPSLPGLLHAGGVAAFECGAGQGDRIAALMRDAGLVAPAVYLDLAGHDRVIVATKQL